MTNLSNFIRFHAQRTPDRPAIVYAGETVSYGAFHLRIMRTAGWLRQRGIGAGDVVAILMKNSLSFVELSFAISHVGAILLPINFRLSRAEVSYILENAEARLLLADEELTAGREHGVDTIVLNTAAQHDLLPITGDAEPVAATTRSSGQMFRLMYTSGTTDRPKGVTHSYENFYWKCADHMVILGLAADTRLLVAGPLYHVGAFDLPGIAVLWAGGTLFVHREFDPAAILTAIERDRLNAAWLAPVMTSAILSHPQRQEFDLSSMRWVIGGGDRTPENRIRAFSDLFTNARYIDCYGLTESCSGDTFMEAGREIEKIGSTGRAAPHVEISIRNDDGDALGAGVAGEICLRGPKVTMGYWKDPRKTADSFFDDWFRTGDIGHLDSEGFLFITDRKKDMILSGGENIASSEIERVLYALGGVREVAVIGVPDERWGERPVAVIVLEDGAQFDREAVQRHCRQHLAGFKVPRQFVLRDSLPRNPSGKILKRQLRDDIGESA